MDKAKAAVSGFLKKDGKHDTTVHETVNKAVTNENVTRTHHEDVTTAIDREVHQDHHHTSIQPILQKEVAPEQHTHNVVGVEHRNIKHGNDDHVQQKLAAEAAQFKDTRTVGETQHTQSSNGAVVGEHVHHHVHEAIQPVIQKETVQSNVVHTTVPIHEIHQNEAKHHTASQLPPVTMDEFKHQGGSLGGREERTDAFAGQPKSVGGTLGGEGARGTTSLTEAEGGSRGTGHHHGTHNTQGTTGSSATTGTTGTTGTSGTSGTSDYSDTTGTSGTKKASLMDKLNPKVDSNGDGQAGFMK